MNVDNLLRWIRTVNDTNGFDAPAWDTLPTKLMLVVTELHEAREAVRGYGEDPLSEELADTAIRLFDILGSVWSSHVTLEPLPPGRYDPSQPIEEMLWRPLRFVCLAVEAWRRERRDHARSHIVMALREIYAMGEALGYSMDTEVRQKVAKNSEREYLHGKKRSDG